MEAEIVLRTRENLTLSASENDVLHSEQSTMVTELPSVADISKSKVTSSMTNGSIDGVDANCVAGAGDSKLQESLMKLRNNNFPMKNKRKRRRGKPKSNTKPYKKSNWKFQKPRGQQNRMCDGGACGRNGMRSKLARSRSIVPYNTNDFLMEEHMAEVPGALLTPSGRTRDSSFSVDSEDNYFFSLPEDEEEFLTKEFANVYERARVERLEAMTKQQLIEECLQLEHKYADGSPVQGNGVNDFNNKIRILEEKIRDLSAENMDLRRRLERRTSGVGHAKKKQHDEEQMCSSTSEDSESDSSSSTSSSCSSSEYSGRHSRRSSISEDEYHCDEPNDNDLRMDSDDIAIDQSVNDVFNLEQQNEGMCNGYANGQLTSISSTCTSPSATVEAAEQVVSPERIQNLIQQQSPAQQQQQPIDANSND